MGWLALIGGLVAVVRPRRAAEDPGPLRWYAVAVGSALLLHVAMIKWQPWGNRLLLYALVLAVPLAGLWLDALFRRRAPAGAVDRGSVAVLTAVTVLATCALAGSMPRPLTASRSSFSSLRAGQRRPERRPGRERPRWTRRPGRR